jgi:hypothetical protein
MKKVILLAAFCLSLASSFGQRVRFTDTSNAWGMIDSNTGCCILIPVSYTKGWYDNSAPVAYAGHSYQYLRTALSSFLVREDAGRVYTLDAVDSTERVLYDFNLSLYDTMRTVYTQDIFTAWVDQVDSTQLGGQWYKVWHFTGTDSSLFYADSVRPLTYNVIEEIGCTNGLYYPLSPYSLNAFSEQLMCFTSRLGIGTGLSSPVTCYGFDYTSSYDNSSSCTDFTEHYVPPVNGIPQIRSEHTALVAPDPVNEQSKILLPYPIMSGNLVIVNQLGQVVVRQAMKNTAEVQIGDNISVPGSYYYRVTDHINSRVFTGTFVR